MIPTSWEQMYDLLHVKGFIYYISSPTIQDNLFGIKLVFIAFSLFFFGAVMYFYINSTYLQYEFLQDTIEFLSWQSFGSREINRKWDSIMKGIKSGTESEYKLAVIEADDFLYQVLEEKDFEGDSLEELIQKAGPKRLQHYDEMLQAHSIRNAIVYDTSYSLDSEVAKQILTNYESAIKSIALS
jgi:hypothetical protein